MDYTIFSEIDIKTSSNEKFLIYWKNTEYYENNARSIRSRQVIQYITGLRVLPITFDVILEFVKLEKGERLQLILEEYWPLGNIERVAFESRGNIREISYRK